VLERIPENPLDENALMLLRVAPTSPISDYSMLDYCAATARAQREHQQQREGEGGETGSDDVTAGRAPFKSVGFVLRIEERLAGELITIANNLKG